MSNQMPTSKYKNTHSNRPEQCMHTQHSTYVYITGVRRIPDFEILDRVKSNSWSEKMFISADIALKKRGKLTPAPTLAYDPGVYSYSVLCKIACSFLKLAKILGVRKVGCDGSIIQHVHMYSALGLLVCLFVLFICFVVVSFHVIYIFRREICFPIS